MENTILSYLEICQIERINLQKGMNYGIGNGYSIILMSVRAGAPYDDRFEDGGKVLIYEGHDEYKSKNNYDPKKMNQPEFFPSGKLTENGKFHKAAQDYKNGIRKPEVVKVYEKIRSGIWSYDGLFLLVDSWKSRINKRTVFKFKLIPTVENNVEINHNVGHDYHQSRIIPTSVKLEVWKRDKGKCVICGSKTELHFDHIIPWSMGGTSIKAENIQLLCARHNLAKHNNIE